MAGSANRAESFGLSILPKGYFRFVPCLYLKAAVESVEAMALEPFDQMIQKYVEMNVVHPFRDGNSRSIRNWLVQMLKQQLGMVIDGSKIDKDPYFRKLLCDRGFVIDWSKIDKDPYLSAMERSVVNDMKRKALLESVLCDQIGSREVFLKGIDHSFYLEGYNHFDIEELE